MYIKRLLINDFRNLEYVELQPCSGFNFICGPNGSGKTSVIEAIHYLSLARSFRTSTYQYLIQQGKPQFNLFAQIKEDGLEVDTAIGLARPRLGEPTIKINADPICKDKLQVVFLENYRVSLAEKLMPASELSEQISTAGKEASGTGNMKFMMNGAVTIGTMDGANIEIHSAVGDENIFIFGLLANEVEELSKNGYEPTSYYHHNARIKAVIDGLHAGIAGVSFGEIADSLTVGSGGADPYKVLADFQSYCDAQDRLDRAYSDRERWGRMSLMNTAESGFFSSDRSVKEYADRIWNLKPVRMTAKKSK